MRCGYLDSYDTYDYNGVDISGRAQLLYAPELTWSLGAEHVSQIMGGELILTANYSYQDEVYTQTRGLSTIRRRSPRSPLMIGRALTCPRRTCDTDNVLSK